MPRTVEILPARDKASRFGVDVRVGMPNPNMVRFEVAPDLFSGPAVSLPKSTSKAIPVRAVIQYRDYRGTAQAIVLNSPKGFTVNVEPRTVGNLARKLHAVEMETAGRDYVIVTVVGMAEAGKDRRKTKKTVNVWLKALATAIARKGRDFDPFTGSPEVLAPIPRASAYLVHDWAHKPPDIRLLVGGSAPRPPEIQVSVGPQFQPIPHPGTTLRDFLLKRHRTSAKELVDQGIDKLELEGVLSGKRPFDEKMRDALRPYIGKDAQLMFQAQMVFDYESRTGKLHSGKWIQQGNDFTLAPE